MIERDYQCISLVKYARFVDESKELLGLLKMI